ncbi:MAG: hypothetical protein H5U40_16430, partial [Polyangiaceae bacterium]|nr:hypothetical protein [Polyangiaceae bacterium]
MPYSSFAAAAFLLVVGAAITQAHAQPLEASIAIETCEPGTFGCYMDPAGRWLAADDAYEALVRPAKRHYLRAALEELLFVGVGAT